MSNDPYAEIQRLVATLPDTESELVNFVRGLSSEGQSDLAAEGLRRALDQHNSFGLRLELATIYMHMQKFKEAMAEAVALLKENPADPDSLLLMAEALLACDEEERASKILDKATMAGVDAARIEAVRKRGPRLPDERTEPNAFLATNEDETGPIVQTEKPKSSRRGRGTVAGQPNRAFPISEVGKSQLPKINKASLDALDEYGDGPRPDDSILQAVPESIQDQAFDQLLSEMGVPVEDAPPEFVPPPKEMPPAAQPQYRAPHPPPPTAGPEDVTTALVLNESELTVDIDQSNAPPASDVAAPSDKTEAIIFDDVVGAPKANTGNEVPSVEYDPHFAQEVSEAESEEFTAHPSGFRQSNYAELAAALDQYEEPAPQAFPDDPPTQPNQFDEAAFREDQSRMNPPAAPTPVANVTAHTAPSYALHPAPGHPQGPAPRQQPYEDPQRIEPTNPAAARPASAGLPNKMAILGALAALGVVLLFVGIVAVSSISESNGLEELLVTATNAEKSDTYDGYITARKALQKASTHTGFLGISLPGSDGPKLRSQAKGRLAFVSSLLTARFGEEIQAEAEAEIQEADEADPLRHAANVYLDLAKNDPLGALKKAEAAVERYPGNSPVAESHVSTLLALNRDVAARQATDSIRAQETPSVRAQYLAASAERRGGANAVGDLNSILEASPEHIEARIELAYALLDRNADKKQRKVDVQRAEDMVSEILDGDLRQKCSQFQIARATAASGFVKLAKNDAERAEIKFRDALQLLPKRADFYQPLIQLYIDTGRYKDADSYFQKAEENGAKSPSLAILRGEFLVRTSRPDEAVHVLQQLPFEHTEKQWWLGMGFFDLDRLEDATKTFRAGSKLPFAPKRLAAASFAMHFLDVGKKANDDAYAVEKLAKDSDDAWILWAGALVSLQRAKLSKKASSRRKEVKEAIGFLNKAQKLLPSEERFQFLECEIHLENSDAKKAETSCMAGRKLNKEFVSGALVLAKLRRAEGRYKEAREVLEPLTKALPKDVRLGVEMARVALATGQLDEAESIVNQHLPANTDLIILDILQGRIALERQAYTKAAGYLQKAAEQKNPKGEALVFFGHVMTILNRFDDANKALLDGLSDPLWGGHAWMYLGELRRAQGKLKDARENLVKARSEFKERIGPRQRYSTLYAYRALEARDRMNGNWGHPNVKKMLDVAVDQGDEEDPFYHWVAAQYELGKKQPDLNAADRHLTNIANRAPYRCDAIKTWVKVREVLKDDKALKEAKTVESENCGG